MDGAAVTQPSLPAIISHRPDPSHSYDIQRVISGARIDAMVAHACRRGCDPRGEFIKRPELDEKWWPLYRESFNETALKLLADESTTPSASGMEG